MASNGHLYENFLLISLHPGPSLDLARSSGKLFNPRESLGWLSFECYEFKSWRIRLRSLFGIRHRTYVIYLFSTYRVGTVSKSKILKIYLFIINYYQLIFWKNWFLIFNLWRVYMTIFFCYFKSSENHPYWNKSVMKIPGRVIITIYFLDELTVFI